MEACIRTILAHEDVALAVRGPRIAFSADGTKKTRRWAEVRRSSVDRQIAELCKRLHVEYAGYEVGDSHLEAPETFQGDLVHGTEAAHASQGRVEGEAMLRAWQAVHANRA